jgi:hypothetical protein
VQESWDMQESPDEEQESHGNNDKGARVRVRTRFRMMSLPSCLLDALIFQVPRYPVH